MLIRNLVLATTIFLVTLVLGMHFAQDTSAGIMKQVDELLKPVRPTGNLSLLLLLIIFINNAIKTLGAILFGILLGLPPLLFASLNGFIIGGFVSETASLKGWEYVAAGLVPHGIIEFPMLLLATAMGFTVGVESLKWLLRRESRVKSQLSACLKLYLRLVLPALAVAALIEVFITPLLVRLVAAG